MKLGARSARRRRRGFIAGAAALAVGATLLAAPARAETGGGTNAQAFDPCPEPVPIADVKAATEAGGPGMVGDALTVVKGTDLTPFKVNVLGVLNDGIRPGRDMVIFEIASAGGPEQPEILDKGVWAGMSGSPVYVGGKLLGAISYGFTLGPSPIGGITPAADMMDVLSLSPAAVAPAKARTKVTLTAAQRKAVAAKATAQVPSGALQEIRTPLSVNGLSGKRMASLQRALDKSGKSFLVYSGGRVGAAGGASTPVPGGNFAAVISSGDFSAAGVGTATAVCDNKVLAFGHPMDYIGQSSYGANEASAIAIVKDPTTGSFKMANVGGSFGTVDQDRIAAIRATVGAGPATTAVSSTITNSDNGKTRSGTSEVAVPDYLAFSTANALWGNYDSTFDKWGKGVATSSWTIRGTRAGGKPFVLSRSNVWSDLGDVTNDPTFEVAEALDALVSNASEPVKITSVDFKSKASSAYESYRITKIAVSANGGKYKSGVVKVKPKSTLKVRVTYRGYRSTTDRNLWFNLGKVSKRYAKKTGMIVVTGGQSGLPSDDDDEGLEEDLSCLLEDCDDPAGDLDALMSDLTSGPANNAVQAYIGFGGVDPEVDDPTAKTGTSAPVDGVKAIVLKVKKK